MKVYIDDAGFFRNRILLKRCFDLLSSEAHFDLHIKSSRKVSLFSLVLLVIFFRKIRSIELTQDIRYTTLPVILFANAKNSFSFKLLVNCELSEKDIRKIKKLRGPVFIEDVSGLTNEKFYSKHRNIIYKTTEHDCISEWNYYGIAAGAPIKCCEFSACLGKNVYISHSGTASFCPKKTKQTEMCNIFESDSIFSNDVFMDVLEKSIEKRYSCSGCSFKTKCNGFCPVDDCSVFKDKYISAREDIQKIIYEKTNLSSIPLYKEIAILYNLLNAINLTNADCFGKEEHYEQIT